MTAELDDFVDGKPEEKSCDVDGVTLQAGRPFPSSQRTGRLVPDVIGDIARGRPHTRDRALGRGARDVRPIP